MSPTWGWVFLAYLGIAALRLGVIDARTQIIPDRQLYLFGAGAAALSLLMEATTAHAAWAVLRGAEMALALGLAYLALAYLSGGLGLGDVKLALLVGYLVGLHSYASVLVGFEVAALIGGVVAVIALAGGRGRKSRVPYAPIMLAGALAGAAFGQQLMSFATGALT